MTCQQVICFTAKSGVGQVTGSKPFLGLTLKEFDVQQQHTKNMNLSILEMLIQKVENDITLILKLLYILLKAKIATLEMSGRQKIQ